MQRQSGTLARMQILNRFNHACQPPPYKVEVEHRGHSPKRQEHVVVFHEDEECIEDHASNVPAR